MATGEALTRQLEASLELQARRAFLGGSDIAAVLGVSPWKTPYQLWMEKTGQGGQEIDPLRQKMLRRGKLMEPVVIQMAREEFDLEIVATNQRYTDPELPYLSCEIDFEWWDRGRRENADVKTVNPRMAKHWGEQGSDEVPVYYTAQFLFGQMVTGRESTLCTALIGADDLRVYRVERDEGVITWMRYKAREFWNLVEKRIPPPLTSLADVNLAWPRDSGRSIEATPEIAEMIERYKLLGRSLAGDEAKRELLEFEIFKFMAERTEIVSSDGRRLATRKLQERKGYTVEPASFRVFRVS